MSDNSRHLGMDKETTQGIVDPSASRMRVYLPQEEKSKAPIKISFERDGMLYEGTAYYVGDVKKKDK